MYTGYLPQAMYMVDNFDPIKLPQEWLYKNGYY